jgi:hypothetical protein
VLSAIATSTEMSIPLAGQGFMGPPIMPKRQR